MDNTSHVLTWFEIPVLDLARAKKFYETIFNIQMHEMPEIFGMKMAAFPCVTGSNKIVGALCESELHLPCMDGALIYLNADPSIQVVLDRVGTAGGQVLMPQVQISPEAGSIAFFIDTEGNRIGLHTDYRSM